MSHTDLAYLKEMGIQSYELSHPKRLQGYQSQPIELGGACQLLLVSPELPQGEVALFLDKILGAMKLNLDVVKHVYPHQLGSVDFEPLAWVWFAGCDKQELASVKVLTSPVLSQIDGNTDARRALWQQIKPLL